MTARLPATPIMDKNIKETVERCPELHDRQSTPPTGTVIPSLLIICKNKITFTT